MGRAEYVQISLDDVKGAFKYLAAHPETGSIFDTLAFGVLRELHQEYGTEFSLFCMYRSGGFSLEQVSDRWRKEFQDNQDWIHFGFHALDENSNYEKAAAASIAADYRITMEEVRRITGINSFEDTIRLHGFSGSREVCRTLKTLGVRCLLTADDERCSYYLNKAENDRVRQEGTYWEEGEEILFCVSLPRLEQSENPVGMMEKQWRKTVEKNSGETGTVIAVFTHEWQLDRKDIREKLRACCEWEQRLRTGEV